MSFSSVNPATEEMIATYAEHGPADIGHVIARADAAQKEWGRRPRAERADIVRRLGEVLRENAPDAGRIITTEMGKPLVQAVAEVTKCATACTTRGQSHYCRAGIGLTVYGECRGSWIPDSYVRYSIRK